MNFQAIKLKVAGWLVGKGSVQPFNQIPLIDGGPGDKLASADAYAKSVWVQRAIKKVSGPICSVPVYWSTDANGDNEVDMPELEKFWAHPARGLEGDEFKEALIGWLSLAGECFVLLDDRTLVSNAALPFPEAGTSMPPVIVARPDRMRHVVSGGVLTGWQYTDGAGRSHLLSPEQVIHKKLWNPFDEWRGLSPLESAMIAAEADYLAGKFNLTLMRNNGDRGPYIVAKKPIQPEQETQIVAQLRAKAAAAARGQSKAVFLTDEVTVEDPKVQAMDANVVAQRLQNRHEIFIAFGVPPSMADVQASYSIGSASDRFMLIEETCMPMGRKVAGVITTITQKITGRELYACLDWDDHSTMQQVRTERIDAGTKLWDRGWSWEDISSHLSMGMKPFDGWDKRYLPFSVQPVDGGASDPLPTETTPVNSDPSSVNSDPSPVDAMKAIFAKRNTSTLNTQPACPHCKAGNTEWDREVDRRARLLRSKLRSFFFDQRSRVLAKLEQQYGTRGAGVPPVVRSVEDIFNFEDENAALMKAVSKVLQADFEAGALKLAAEIGAPNFKLPPTAAISYLNKREQFIHDINETTFDSLKGSLQEGLDAGETFQQLSDRVRSQFNDISKSRADTIASTEVNTALNTGRHEGMVEAGVELKSWKISSLDNVRAAHIAAQRDTTEGIPINAPFMVGGFPMMHPSDSSLGAPPEMTINCRCFVVPVLKS